MDWEQIHAVCFAQCLLKNKRTFIIGNVINNLNVYAEVKGQSLLVGVIDTQPGYGEGFTYSSEWISKGYPKISVSLPITEEHYSARKMRPYFDGLLPEGTIRARVTSDLHVSQAAYTKILAEIGWECIGAVSFGNPEEKPSCAFKKLRIAYE
jgi:serine/threonine-protein kinase HipA